MTTSKTKSVSAINSAFRWGSPAATTMVHRAAGNWYDPGDVWMVRSFMFR